MQPRRKQIRSLQLWKSPLHVRLSWNNVQEWRYCSTQHLGEEGLNVVLFIIQISILLAKGRFSSSGLGVNCCWAFSGRCFFVNVITTDEQSYEHIHLDWKRLRDFLFLFILWP
jgi:hypothetical protein